MTRRLSIFFLLVACNISQKFGYGVDISQVAKLGTLIDYSGTYSSPWFQIMNAILWGDSTGTYNRYKSLPYTIYANDSTLIYRLLNPYATVSNDGNLYYCGESPVTSGDNMFQRRLIWGSVNRDSFSRSVNYVNKSGNWDASGGPFLDDTNQKDLFKFATAHLLSSRICVNQSNSVYLTNCRTPERWCYSKAGRIQYNPCPTCNGSGRVGCPTTQRATCPICYGSCVQPCPICRSNPGSIWSSVTCWTCGGWGRVNCSACGGSGGWWFQTCLWCGGSGRWWLFGWWTCDFCGGAGGWWNHCGTCGGSGTVTCGTCGGDGLAEKWVTCWYCGGSGKISCSNCGGAGQINVTCPICGGSGSKTCPTCGGSGRGSSYVPPDYEGFNAGEGYMYPFPINQLSCDFKNGIDKSNRIWTFWSYAGAPAQEAPGRHAVQRCNDYRLLGGWIYGVYDWWDGVNNHPTIGADWFPFSDRDNRIRVYSRVCFDDANNAYIVANRAITLGIPGWTWGHDNHYFVYNKFNSVGTLIDTDLISDDGYFMRDRDLILLSYNGQIIPTVLSVRDLAYLRSTWANGVVLFSRTGPGQWVISNMSNCVQTLPTDSSSWTYRFQQYNDYLVFAVCVPPNVILTYGVFTVENNAIRLLSQLRYENFIADCGRIVSMDVKAGHLWITYMNYNFRLYRYCHIYLPDLLK